MIFLKNKINFTTAIGTKINRYSLCKSIKDKNSKGIKSKYIIYRIRKIKNDSLSTIKYQISTTRPPNNAVNAYIISFFCF